MSLQSRAVVWESVIRRAYSAVRLLDGTTGLPLTAALQVVTLSATRSGSTTPAPVPDVASEAGLLKLTYRDDVEVVRGVASESAVGAASAHGPIDLAGGLEDPAGRYNLTAFGLTIRALNRGDPVPELSVFRTPHGTPIGSAGALIGTLRIDQREGEPAAYARLTAVFNVRLRLNQPPTEIKIETEADRQGDFIVPLERLPALTGTDTSRTGVLRAQLPREASPAAAGLPLRRASFQLTSTSRVTELPLDVVPGRVIRLPAVATLRPLVLVRA